MFQAIGTTVRSVTGLETWPQPTTEMFSQFLGSDVRDLDGPAVVLDLNVIRRNCDLMLETTDTLQVSWRAHVKTHSKLEYSIVR